MEEVLSIKDWLVSKNAQFRKLDLPYEVFSRLKDGIYFQAGYWVEIYSTNSPNNLAYTKIKRFERDMIHICLEKMGPYEYNEYPEINDIQLHVVSLSAGTQNV